MNSLLKKILTIAAPMLLSRWLRSKKIAGKAGLLLLLIVGGMYLLAQYAPDLSRQQTSIPGEAHPPGTERFKQSDIRSLFNAQRSGIMVHTSAYVRRLLKDDDDGARHQRFLIEIPSGLTLLVAHNIDLAPRVPLNVNDQVLIYGQYEWNHQGGVLHWTHHDPNNRHAEGWIKHQGKRYQ